MAWAATWMYVATGTITYLEDAYNYWTMHRNVSASFQCRSELCERSLVV